jgi:hypothetical protein
LLVYLFFRGTEQVATLNHLLEQDRRNRALWIYFAFRAAVPIVAILLSVLGSRFAKWANVGLFAFFGAAFLVTGVWNWSDYHGHVYLLLGPIALMISGVNLLLYRKSKSATPQSSL